MWMVGVGCVSVVCVCVCVCKRERERERERDLFTSSMILSFIFSTSGSAPVQKAAAPYAETSFNNCYYE